MIIAVIKLHTEVMRTQGEENDNTLERGTKNRYKERGTKEGSSAVDSKENNRLLPRMEVRDNQGS